MNTILAHSREARVSTPPRAMTRPRLRLTGARFGMRRLLLCWRNLPLTLDQPSQVVSAFFRIPEELHHVGVDLLL